ncbi:MAG: squalene/phytoene synthase family protein [Hyphomonadaceae bacterium]|nr:squalene/phytoene synthase family protein [Hyphomonadaceae bacterium]
MDEDLDALVRRVDEDRWLAARFAPKPARARLIALYAVNYEAAKTAAATHDETLGDIRLAWWDEQIAKALSDAPGEPPHPALAALRAAHLEAPFTAAEFAAMIAAREHDLAQAPFATWAELEAYVDATSGALMRLALEACGDAAQAGKRHIDAFSRLGGRAWGYAGLVRALPHWTARRATFFPENLRTHVGLNLEDFFAGATDHAARSATMAVLDRSRNYYRQAKDLAALLPAPCFPAFGYLRLLPGYLRALSGGPGREPSAQGQPLLQRQIALVAGSAMGRI